jgi:hypothetical protein
MNPILFFGLLALLKKLMISNLKMIHSVIEIYNGVKGHHITGNSKLPFL